MRIPDPTVRFLLTRHSLLKFSPIFTGKSLLSRNSFSLRLRNYLRGYRVTWRHNRGKSIFHLAASGHVYCIRRGRVYRFRTGSREVSDCWWIIVHQTDKEPDDQIKSAWGEKGVGEWNERIIFEKEGKRGMKEGRKTERERDKRKEENTIYER